MPSTFIFGCLELKRRSYEILFPKSIVCCDVVSDKLGQRYMSFIPSKIGESKHLKIAKGY